MSTELQEFSDLIEDLKSVISQPDFDSQFKVKAKGVPKAKQFLIKMELKRLAQPCNRMLDLRGNVIGEPFEYEHKGQIHFLDEVARQIFEDQLSKFGRYTIGGYEAVLSAENNHRVLHKKEQEERIAQKNAERQQTVAPAEQEKVEQKKDKEFGGSLIHFTSYGIRTEERMNFSISVELQFAIGDTLRAVSSDLSVGGIKVKVPAARKVVPGQKIAVYLVGMEEEFELGLKDGIQYEVVAIDELNSSHNYLRMKRTFTEDIAAFDEFLANFINGNKRRYKVNLDNTLEAVTIKGFEQYYLPRVTTLPVYIRMVHDRLLPTLALATENNRATLGYFSDENKNLVLQQILNQNRIEQLLDSPKLVKETLLYSFTHAKAGKLYFYSATQEELNKNQQLRHTFLKFGSSKPTWNVFKLQLVPASEQDAHIPLSVPDSAGKEIQRLNRMPSPKVQGLLKGLKFLIFMTPIKQPGQEESYQSNYALEQPVKALNKFGHPKLKRYVSIEVETIDYVNLRSEERYLYKSAAQVVVPDSNDSEFIDGAIRDFSPHGLQIVLEKPAQFSKGDIVVLALPELQKVTQKYNLSKLAYELVAISRDKCIMNMRVYEPKGFHHARMFFKKLIAQNRAKLTPAKMESRYPGLSKALRNLFAKHVSNTPIYFEKEGPKTDVNVLGSSGEQNLLLKLLQQFKPQDHEVSLYPLLKDNAANTVFAPVINDMERTDKPKIVELYIRHRENQASEARSFICHYDKQFLSADMLNSFVKASTKNDVFFAFRIYISKTGRPDMDYVAKELSYIGHYAQHRAKELEGRLWNVAGVGDIIDISEEVMMRLGIPPEEMQQQTEKRNKLIERME